jgi:uncharacterized RDD family membrane protein YckC
MTPAGFWRRAAAYLLDVLPIVLVIAAGFYVFLGFDETWRAYRAEPRDFQARLRFLDQRNQIRDSAFVVWLIYGTILEASTLQGTFGKRLMGIRVVRPDGSRLTLARSMGRNAAKLLSYIPLCLGFFWAAFSKQKRTWHDMIANTHVVAFGDTAR